MPVGPRTGIQHAGRGGLEGVLQGLVTEDAPCRTYVLGGPELKEVAEEVGSVLERLLRRFPPDIAARQLAKDRVVIRHQGKYSVPGAQNIFRTMSTAV
jgi:hypothetical protein